MRQTVFQLSIYTMFLFGALDMLKGIAAPLMQQDWHLTYSQLGYVFSSSSLGFLIGSLMAGFAVNRVGLKGVGITGAFGYGLGLCAVIFLKSYLGLISGFLILGIGNGWLEIGVNGVVPALGLTSTRQTKFFNILHGFYGVGATVFPVVAAYLIRLLHGWRMVYATLLVLLVVILLRMVFTRYPGTTSEVVREGTHVQEMKFQMVLKDVHLYWFLFAIMFYVMAEGGMGSWLVTFLVHIRQLSLGEASWMLAGFYGTFSVGRLLAHTLVERIGAGKMILLSAVFSILTLCLAQFGGSWCLYLYIFAGFGFAAIFPTITAVASHVFHQHAQRVLGFLFFFSGVGSFLASWTIGQVSSSHFGLAVGFPLVIVYLFVVVICSLVTYQRANISHRVESQPAT